MKILVMRHGEAESFTSAGDAKRKLTERGREQAGAAGRYLHRLGFSPDAIWVSPYLRARQTADAVQQYLSVPHDLTKESLTPDADVGALVEEILAAAPPSLMLVSHQPLVSYLLARLSGQDPYAVPAMSTASIVLLQAPEAIPGCFDIVWEKHSPDFVERGENG